ncbi:hypothetical protein DFH06DRAFT_1141291 [Mycena polygramma]|nr:hypothetical protein DFH06DRAFT_1141291 [Mycena polygramma]
MSSVCTSLESDLYRRTIRSGGTNVSSGLRVRGRRKGDSATATLQSLPVDPGVVVGIGAAGETGDAGIAGTEAAGVERGEEGEEGETSEVTLRKPCSRDARRERLGGEVTVSVSVSGAVPSTVSLLVESGAEAEAPRNVRSRDARREGLFEVAGALESTLALNEEGGADADAGNGGSGSGGEVEGREGREGRGESRNCTLEVLCLRASVGASGGSILGVWNVLAGAFSASPGSPLASSTPSTKAPLERLPRLLTLANLTTPFNPLPSPLPKPWNAAPAALPVLRREVGFEFAFAEEEGVEEGVERAGDTEAGVDRAGDTDADADTAGDADAETDKSDAGADEPGGVNRESRARAPNVRPPGVGKSPGVTSVPRDEFEPALSREGGRVGESRSGFKLGKDELGKEEDGNDEEEDGKGEGSAGGSVVGEGGRCSVGGRCSATPGVLPAELVRGGSVEGVLPGSVEAEREEEDEKEAGGVVLASGLGWNWKTKGRTEGKYSERQRMERAKLGMKSTASNLGTGGRGKGMPDVRELARRVEKDETKKKSRRKKLRTEIRWQETSQTLPPFLPFFPLIRREDDAVARITAGHLGAWGRRHGGQPRSLRRARSRVGRSHEETKTKTELREREVCGEGLRSGKKFAAEKKRGKTDDWWSAYLSTIGGPGLGAVAEIMTCGATYGAKFNMHVLMRRMPVAILTRSPCSALSSSVNGPLQHIHLWFSLQ